MQPRESTSRFVVTVKSKKSIIVIKIYGEIRFNEPLNSLSHPSEGMAITLI